MELKWKRMCSELFRLQELFGKSLRNQAPVLGMSGGASTESLDNRSDAGPHDLQSCGNWKFSSLFHG